jgi:WD40 repeat protein
VDVTRGELEGAPIECEAGIGSLALQRDNRMIVAGSTRGKLYSVDLATHSCRELERSQIVSGNVGLVTALAFSPNGEFLASGDSEGALATWTLGGRLRANYLQDPNNSARAINSIAWTRDGSALVVGGIAHKRLWPLGSGKVTNLQSEADYSRVTAMSRDGHLIAGSSLEGVQLWDVSSGRVLMRFMIDRPADKVDDDTVTALAFSGNGQLLAVGQEDGWISLFDLGEHRWLGDLPTSGRCSSSACAVWSLDFSPDSSRLAAFVARKLLLWQLDAENWVRHACELANREFSASEVQRYLRADSPPGEICGVRTARVVNPPGPETRR